MVAGAEKFLRERRKRSQLRRALYRKTKGRILIFCSIATGLGLMFYRLTETYRPDMADAVFGVIIGVTILYSAFGAIEMLHGLILERKKS